MKKITISVCALALALAAIPVFASVPSDGKNKFLNGNNCQTFDSLPERIGKLNKEIARGEKVYTPKELDRLKTTLKEDNEEIRVLQKPGK